MPLPKASASRGASQKTIVERNASMAQTHPAEPGRGALGQLAGWCSGQPIEVARRDGTDRGALVARRDRTDRRGQQQRRWVRGAVARSILRLRQGRVGAALGVRTGEGRGSAGHLPPAVDSDLT